MQIGVTN